MIDIEQFKLFSDEEKNHVFQDVLVEFLTRELSPSEEQNVLNMIDHCAPYQLFGAMLFMMQPEICRRGTEHFTTTISSKMHKQVKNILHVLKKFSEAMEAATEDPLKFDQEFEVKMTQSFTKPFIENALLKFKKRLDQNRCRYMPF